MHTLDQFHDGFLDGIRVEYGESRRACLYVRTVEGDRFTATMDGVVALNMDGFKEGNIIFDVSVLAHNEIKSEHIVEVYDLPLEDEVRSKMISKLLDRVAQDELNLVRIDPSYGASCAVLGRDFTLVEDAATLSPKSGEKDGAPRS